MNTPRTRPTIKELELGADEEIKLYKELLRFSFERDRVAAMPEPTATVFSCD